MGLTTNYHRMRSAVNSGQEIFFRPTTELGGWLCMDVLKKVAHRYFVFSFPKILRRYFIDEQKRLHDQSC